MADEQNKAVIGLDDIAWGQGTELVPTYGGKTREITKINLTNMPFDDSRSLGQVLQETTTLLQSQDYANIQAHLNEIIAVKNHLDDINAVVGNIPLLSQVSNDLDKVRLVFLNLSKLEAIENDAENVHKDVYEIKYIRCELKRVLDAIRLKVLRVDTLINDKLDPLDVKMDAMEARLTDMLANAVATVNQGNDMAVKLGTYNLKVVGKRNCYNPRVDVNDSTHTITWYVPTVKGDCSVINADNLPTSMVADVVDRYLTELNCCSGGVINNNELATVDYLEPLPPTTIPTTFDIRNQNSELIGGVLYTVTNVDSNEIVANGTTTNTDAAVVYLPLTGDEEDTNYRLDIDESSLPAGAIMTGGINPETFTLTWTNTSYIINIEYTIPQQSSIPQDGLSYYFPLNSDRIDATGNNHDITAVGDVPNSTPINILLNSDGYKNIVVHSPDVNSSSITFKINFDFKAGYRAVGNKQTAIAFNDPNGGTIYFEFNEAGIRVGWSNNDNINGETGFDYNYNSDIYMTVTQRRTTVASGGGYNYVLDIWINGIKVSSNTGESDGYVRAFLLETANYTDDSDNTSSYTVSEISGYDRALTDAEIQAIHT